MHVQAFQPRLRRLFLLTLSATLPMWGCSNSQGPAPLAARIALVSGDGQYSKAGTELTEPVVAKVTFSDGSPATGELVRFAIVDGGGSLSRATANVTSNGTTSVHWTLGPSTGTQHLKVSVASDASVAVVAQATSSVYYCPEEDPTFARKFTPQRSLFLLTNTSALTASGGQPRVGVVRLDFNAGTFAGTLFRSFEQGPLINVLRDCAFSSNGDFFVAWTDSSAVREIIKLNPDGTYSHFASLDSYYGTEITTLPGGVLAGCDEFGPFTVGCRDTLTRYDDAVFSGEAPDAANNDAVACDPTSGDLYFIYLADRTLRRVPLNGYVEESPAEVVATLSIDEANGAKGMVVASDGSVYILVESTNTKEIAKVTADGTVSTAVDFFTARGAGNAAGIQSDLAIDRTLGTGFLYTLDTLNNVILVYQIQTGQLDALPSSGGPNDASGTGSGERVGLTVLP